MKLYDFKPAPNPRRVRIFLAEKGIEIPTQQVDLGSGEQFSPEFRRINPGCTVPALELDDGTVLNESLGICAFLDALYPEPPLFGRDAREKGQILNWCQFIEREGFQSVTELFRNSNEMFKYRAIAGPVEYEQIPALVDRSRKRAGECLKVLDSALQTSPFLAGEKISFADIAAFIVLDFGKMGGLTPPDDATALQAWYGKMSDRPSSKA